MKQQTQIKKWDGRIQERQRAQLQEWKFTWVVAKRKSDAAENPVKGTEDGLEKRKQCEEERGKDLELDGNGSRVKEVYYLFA